MFSFISEKLNMANLGEMLAPISSLEEQLHSAIQNNQMDKIKQLIDEQKVSHMARNSAGNVPIHTAAYHGNQEVIDYLLGMNVDINVPGRAGNTSLHYASAMGHADLVKYLVEKNANPALKNQTRKTAYDVAGSSGGSPQKAGVIRQFLLPLQFKSEDPAEAAAALAYLPPGVQADRDPAAIAAAQAALPPPPVFAPPAAGAGGYAAPRPGGGVGRDGQPINRTIQPDGFGSSVGNAALTEKYGNQKIIDTTKGAPPMMGAPAAPAAGAGAPAAPPPAYHGQPAAYAGGRYVTYDATTNSPGQIVGGAAAAAPPAAVQRPPPPAFTIFNPSAANAANAANVAAAPVPGAAPAAGTGN
jgi:hypothetical protein